MWLHSITSITTSSTRTNLYNKQELAIRILREYFLWSRFVHSLILPCRVACCSEHSLRNRGRTVTSLVGNFCIFPHTSILCFCVVVAVVTILCVVYRNYCFFLVSLFFFFFVLVASCTWGSTYCRPGPLVQPSL